MLLRLLAKTNLKINKKQFYLKQVGLQTSCAKKFLP